jgi:hypothetical protein
MHRLECFLPIRPNSLKRFPANVGSSEPADQFSRFLQTAGGSKAKSDFSFRSCRQITGHLDRTARIQTGADFPGKVRTLQGRWIAKSSVPA